MVVLQKDLTTFMDDVSQAMLRKNTGLFWVLFYARFDDENLQSRTLCCLGDSVIPEFEFGSVV